MEERWEKDEPARVGSEIAIRPFHFGSISSFQVLGAASFATSLVVYMNATPAARDATHPAFLPHNTRLSCRRSRRGSFGSRAGREGVYLPISLPQSICMHPGRRRG